MIVDAFCFLITISLSSMWTVWTVVDTFICQHHRPTPKAQKVTAYYGFIVLYYL